MNRENTKHGTSILEHRSLQNNVEARICLGLIVSLENRRAWDDTFANNYFAGIFHPGEQNTSAVFSNILKQ